MTSFSFPQATPYEQNAPIELLPKPKQPLSAYNLFFQLERKRIIAGETIPINAQDVLSASLENKQRQGIKRPHRRTHGKISFSNLASTIAGRWRQIDPHTKSILEDQAAIEKQDYVKRLETYKAQQEANVSSRESQKIFEPFPMQMQQPNQTASNQDISDNRSGPTTAVDMMALQNLRDMIEQEMSRLVNANQRQEQQQQPDLTWSLPYPAAAAPEENQSFDLPRPQRLPQVTPLEWKSNEEQYGLLDWMNARDMDALFD